MAARSGRRAAIGGLYRSRTRSRVHSVYASGRVRERLLTASFLDEARHGRQNGPGQIMFARETQGAGEASSLYLRSISPAEPSNLCATQEGRLPIPSLVAASKVNGP